MGGEGRPIEPAPAATTSSKSSKSKPAKEKAEKAEKAPEKAPEKTDGKSASGTTSKESSSKRTERTSERPAEKEGRSKPTEAELIEKLKAPPAAKAGAAKQGGAARVTEGLTEEVLTQIAQAKFEAQEEKLRDVARFSMALLRDLPKLSAAECSKRVGDVQKALLKYEMQHVRAWEYQERRRRIEVKSLDEEAARFKQEAEAAGEEVPGLKVELEQERQRRKRYEGYEKAAEEVNKKRARTENQTTLEATTEEIARLKQECQDYDALVEERSKRAHLLRSAVAELSLDLQREQQLSGKVLEGREQSAAEKAEAQRPVHTDPIEVIL